MRLLSSIFQQLASGKKGVILEPGDGELVIPPVLQPITELPGPWTGPAPAGINQQTSTLQIAVTQLGANAGGNTDSGVVLGAGIWRIKGFASIQFSGTVNTGSLVSAGIALPNAVDTLLVESLRLYSSPFTQQIPFDVLIHLISNGTFARISTPATVALDALTVHFLALCSRVA